MIRDIEQKSTLEDVGNRYYFSNSFVGNLISSIDGDFRIDRFWLMDLEIKNSMFQIGKEYKFKVDKTWFRLNTNTNQLFFVDGEGKQRLVDRNSILSITDVYNKTTYMDIKEIGVDGEFITFNCLGMDFNKSSKDLSELKGSYENIKLHEIIEKMYDFSKPLSNNFALCCWDSTIPYLIIEDYMKPLEVFNLLQSAYQENLFIYFRKFKLGDYRPNDQVNIVNEINVLFVGWQVWTTDFVDNAIIRYQGTTDYEQIRNTIKEGIEIENNRRILFTKRVDEGSEWFEVHKIQPSIDPVEKVGDDLGYDIDLEKEVYPFPYLQLNYNHIVFGDKIKSWAICVDENGAQRKVGFPETLDDRDAEKVITINFAFPVPLEELKQYARTAYYRNYNNSYTVNLQTLQTNYIPKLEVGQKIYIRLEDRDLPIPCYVKQNVITYNEGGSVQNVDLLIDRTVMSWDERTPEIEKQEVRTDGVVSYSNVYEKPN